MKAGQEVAPVQLQRLRRAIRLHSRFEFCRVAPELSPFDAHLSVSPARHYLRAERTSQVTQRLVEGPASVVLVLLRPEQRQERVPAVEAVRSGNGQVDQEGDALRLRQD